VHHKNGVNFTQVGDEPILTPEMAGSRYGSVQDARVVRIDGRYLMTYAFRPFAWNSSPSGVSVPESWEGAHNEFYGDSSKDMTHTGLATSSDGRTWKHELWLTPSDLDDRDVLLFPEKLGGRYWMLRRAAGSGDRRPRFAPPTDGSRSITESSTFGRFHE